MNIYAVIDTNVLVSALLTKNPASPTMQVVKAMFSGIITPLYHKEILNEYSEVLHRDKFHLKDETIKIVLDAIQEYGIEVSPRPSGEVLIDMDDLIFYEVALEKQSDATYLITGNRKHYPPRDFILTPFEMMELIYRGNRNRA